MVKYHIYLFRHGQTFYNKKKIFTGWSDSRLTPEGIVQAQNLGMMLKEVKIDVAIHSGLGRSIRTLKEVLKFHPECKKIIEDKRMIERGYGELQGVPHKRIIKKYGEEQFEVWHRGYDTPPPNGESFKMVEERIKPFITDLKKMIAEKKVNVAISAHGNSIRMFRKIWENKPVEEVVTWIIPYDKYYEYIVEV
jgi:2,3-bisphosphoglycerate-dependent phosphoglycerate mutase